MPHATIYVFDNNSTDNTYKVTYTNSQNDKFDRHTAGNWPLEYVGKLQKENTYQ